jgi:hypothetical protein
MAQVLLVAEQIDDGKKLIEELARQGFPFTAAGWARTPYDSKWYLYLVSPPVDKQGVRKWYGRLNTVIRQMQQEGFEMDPFEIKLVGPAEPVGKALLELQRRHRGKRPRRYDWARVDGTNLEGACIYPPITVPAQSDT